MASEEPLFDPSLKKRKKKQVAFSEDPLGPDADPTSPAPTSIDNTTANGEAVDLGPTTAHEQMQQNGRVADEDDMKKDEDDMFADMKKKKKKKKEIPMDFVSIEMYIANNIYLNYSRSKPKKGPGHPHRPLHQPQPKISISPT
jgi:translation initiation factor 2 subunit 2